jgi:predicted O-methyltransferase YrrM
MPRDDGVNPPPPAATLAHFPGRPHDQATGPEPWVFPPCIGDPATPWLASLRRLYDHPIAFPASLSPQAGLLLHALVQNLQPRVAVEVGVFCSVSTHWIAGALLDAGATDAQLHCFDNFAPIERAPWREAEMPEGSLDFVRQRLREAGLDHLVRIHPGDSPAEIRDLWDELKAAGGVDLAFIDGDHSIPGTLADFAALEPVLNTGGYVVVHDTYPDRCGGDAGPRHLLDHVRTLRPAPRAPRPRATDHPAAIAREQPVGEGVYDRVDLHLAPANYGLGILRRLA